MSQFYRGVYGTGKSLKNAWKAVTGVATLEKRNIKPAEMPLVIGAGTGFTLGWLPGLYVGVMTNSVIAGLATWAFSVVAGQALLHQPYALYKAGEHDHKLMLLDERKRAAALPAPDPEPKKHAPLKLT